MPKLARELDLEAIRLEAGAHSPDGHFCVMEAVAYVAGEPWSDRPKCVSPVIGAFLRSWNDALGDNDRQRLKPYIPGVVGTRTTKADETTRAWLVTDWLVREFAPAWLELAGLADEAASLRDLEALTSADLANQAMPIITAARNRGDAARDATWAAAGDAAGDAATETLAPTVAALQDSAFALLDRMIAVGQKT